MENKIKKKKKFIKWDTILPTLLKLGNLKYYEVDIRSLNKWIEKYPEVFPKFMREGKYVPIFNGDLLRWEIFLTETPVELNTPKL